MNHYHFIGIKGSGMSALAQILFDLGHHVQGEDIDDYLFTQAPLAAKNIPMYPFGEAPLSSDMTAIASNAYNDEHSSIIHCKELGIPVLRYHHFLGEWMRTYTSIAVTGSHGKTTTTGMMAHALHAASPACYLIGDGSGGGAADARLFVFESCEYRRHFLAYRPDIAVITNIDFDHPDYFTDINDVRQAFEAMAGQTGRAVIACGDDPQVRAMHSSVPVLYYGFDTSNDLRATHMTAHGVGVSFEADYRGTPLGSFTIPAYGRHNVCNALAVIGTALTLDLNMDAVSMQLASFPGVKRRFTERHWDTNVVIDDYAHHPSEIKATLEAVRSKYPHRRVVGIFEPHTYSRLAALLDDFAVSLAGADDVYICPIFGSAREEAGSVSIDELQSRIPHSRLVTETFPDELLACRDAVLVFMGAGDIQKYQALLA